MINRAGIYQEPASFEMDSNYNSRLQPVGP
jgi:hypothetical protein